MVTRYAMYIEDNPFRYEDESHGRVRCYFVLVAALEAFAPNS